jgi:hypothetical protein
MDKNLACYSLLQFPDAELLILIEFLGLLGGVA